MAIDEKTRLDIRQWFELQMGDPDLASAVMQAMPPLDYEQFATKTDLGNLRTELRSDTLELKSDMLELRTELKGDISDMRVELTQLMAATHMSSLRWSVATQLMTIASLGGLAIYLT